MQEKETQETVIEVKHLKMGWPNRVLLNDVSFSIPKGQIVVILGGSGCGKSSLMKNLIGLIQPLEGDVLIKGKSIIYSSEEEIAKLQRGLGVMYQSGALFGSLSVLDNIKFPLDQFTKLPDFAKNLTANLLLNTLEMPHAANLMPGEISGGMLKRAGIARALALGADILFLDEPSAGLDPITAANLDETLLKLRETLNCTFVVVTHELRSIFRIADRALMLDPVTKSIIADGRPKDLRDNHENPRVRQFFNAQPDTETAQ